LPNVYSGVKLRLWWAIRCWASRRWAPLPTIIFRQTEVRLHRERPFESRFTRELSVRELDAYAERRSGRGAKPAPPVDGSGRGDGTATMDFGKLRRAHGYQTGWLMSKLLDGDRPVSVTARIRSAGGRATVDLQRVEISGVAIDGRTLDFLIETSCCPVSGCRGGPPLRAGAPHRTAGDRARRRGRGHRAVSGPAQTNGLRTVTLPYRCPSAKSSLQKTPQPNSTALLTTSASHQDIL